MAVDGPKTARRIAELDVTIAEHNAAVEAAKAERSDLERDLLDYIAEEGVDSFRVEITITGPDGKPTRVKRTVSPRTDTWAFPLDGDQPRALRALRRHFPEIVKPGWSAQTISAIFREADRTIAAGNPDPIPPGVRRAFTLDRRLSIRTTKTS